MRADQTGQLWDGTDNGWTRRRLIAAGFDPELAGKLASEARLDLDELLGLVDHGCPPELAVRIVWPLDQESGER